MRHRHQGKAVRIDLKEHEALKLVGSHYEVVDLMPVTIFEYDDCHSMIFQLELESPNFLHNQYIQFNCLLKDFRDLNHFSDLSIYSVNSINKKASKDFTEYVLKQLVFDFINQTRIAWVFNQYPNFMSIYDERGSNFLRKQTKITNLEEITDEIESRWQKNCG